MAKYATFVFDMKSELAKKMLEHRSFNDIETLRELTGTMCRLDNDGYMVLTVNGEDFKCGSETRSGTAMQDDTIPVNCLGKKVNVDGTVFYNLYEITDDFKVVANKENKEAFSCTECGDFCFGSGTRNPRNGGREDRKICHTCYERLESRGVKDYSYKPRPMFFGSDDVYFGAEIEMEHEDNYDYDDLGENAYNVSSSSNGFAYCKYDASINGGFETVTHPFTLDFAKESGAVEELFDSLESNGMVGGAENGVVSCGVHLHMSRLGVTRSTLFKMLTFIGENKEFVIKISKRTNESRIEQF